MALKLRRGTNAQRLGITFAEGELVYITDSKKLYIGDGASQGGNLVSGMNNLLEDQTPQLGGNLDLNGNNIIGTGNVNITGSLTVATGFLAVDTKGSVFANDSGLLVDGIAGKHVLSNNALGDIGNVAATAPTDGQVLKWNNSASQWQPQADSTGTQLLNTLTDVNAGSPQNLQALVWDSGTNKWIAGDVVQQGEFLDGDFRGSVFGDDSTLIVDGLRNTITASKITVTEIASTTEATNFKSTQSGHRHINITSIDSGTDNNHEPVINCFRESPDPTTRVSHVHGGITFKAINASSQAISNYGYVLGTGKRIVFSSNENGVFDNEHSMAFEEKKFGVGTRHPSYTLDIQGEGVFTNYLRPGVFTNATTRDAAITTPIEGAMVFLQDTKKMQVYVLDTGLAGGGSANTTAGWHNMY
jgi:hypothetical protein